MFLQVEGATGAAADGVVDWDPLYRSTAKENVQVEAACVICILKVNSFIAFISAPIGPPDLASLLRCVAWGSGSKVGLGLGLVSGSGSGLGLPTTCSLLSCMLGSQALGSQAFTSVSFPFLLVCLGHIFHSRTCLANFAPADRHDLSAVSVPIAPWLTI